MAEPIANNDLYAATAGESTTLGVVLNFFGMNLDLGGLLKNDSDADGDALEVVSVEGQALSSGQVSVIGDNGGVFTINANGQIAFDASSGFEYLAAGETVDTTVTYTISDGTTTSTATVTVTVTGIAGDELSVAIDDAFVTNQDGSLVSLDVLSNDASPTSTKTVTEVDGSSTNVGSGVSGSNGGVFTLESTGELSFDPNGAFDYLDDGETALTSITYTLDADGVTSQATITVEVSGTNDGPVAADDSYSVIAGDSGLLTTQVLVGGNEVVLDGLLKNDSDVDGDALEIVSASADGGATSVTPDGSGAITIAGDTGGLFTIYANGKVEFDTGTDFDLLPLGQTIVSSIEYVVSDGDDVSTASLSVSIDGVFEVPPTVEAVEDIFSSTQQVAENLQFNLLDNDISDQGAPSIVAVNGDSSRVDNFTVVYFDDGRLAGIIEVAANGDATFYQPNLRYLKEGEVAEATVEYTIEANGIQSTSVFKIDVTGVNDAPTPISDQFVVDAGFVGALSTTVVVDGQEIVMDSVLANDSDPEEDTISILYGSSDGGVTTIEPNEDGVITLEGNNGGFFSIESDGRISFDGSQGFEDLLVGQQATTSIQYTVSDGEEVSTATISVVIEGQLDAAVAVDDDLSTDQDNAISVNVLDNDIENAPDIFVVDALVGTTQVTEGVAIQGTDGGLFTLLSDGTLDFDPNGEFDFLDDFESVSTQITYFVESTAIPGERSEATVTVTVNGINDAPIVLDEQFDVDVGFMGNLGDVQTVSVDGVLLPVDLGGLLRNDSDIDGEALRIVEVDGQTSIGGGLFQATGSNGGTFYIDQFGRFDFDSTTGTGFIEVNGGETVSTSVSYLVSDGDATSLATVTVNVTGVNNLAVARDDSYVIAENPATAIDITPLANDEDPDSLDNINIVSVDASGLVGDLVQSGNTFTYSSDGFFEGLAQGQVATTSFAYTIQSDDGSTDTATVSIQVTGQNDAPIAVNDFGVQVDADGLSTIAIADLLANDTDVDSGAILSLSGISATSSKGAALSFDTGTGLITFDPSGIAEFEALSSSQTLGDNFSYTIEDQFGATSSGVAVLVVRGVNDAPVASDYDVTVSEENTIVIDTALLLSNFTSDVDDGDVISFVGLANPGVGQGDLTDNGDGTFTYDPTVAYDGLSGSESELVSLDYTVQDLDGELATASVNITVQGFDDV